MADLPDAIQQNEVRIAGNGEVAKIGEGFRGSLGGDNGRAEVTAQDLDNLKVDKMRSVKSRF